MGDLAPCLRHSCGHIHSMLPYSLLAKRDLTAYCVAKKCWGLIARSPGSSCRGTPLSCLDRFFQKSLAKILFAINLQQYTLSRRSNSQDGCIHQSSYKTTPRQAGRKQTVIFQLTNRNLRDIFYTLKDMFFVNFYSGFTKFGTLPKNGSNIEFFAILFPAG